MKKIAIMLAAGLLTVSTLTGCNNTTNTEPTSTVSADTQNQSYVTLGEYQDLAVTQNKYIVSDDMVKEQAESSVQEHAEYNSLDKTSESDDYVKINYTAVVKDNEDANQSEENYELQLGAQDFGEEVDTALTGVKAGDKKNISVDFAEDFGNENWAGHTVDFTIEVVSVDELVYPEYNAKFVKETLGYDSIDAYEASVRKDLEDDYTKTSEQELTDSLIQAAVENSTFDNEYPEDLYNSVKAEIEAGYTSYAQMFGMELEEFYDTMQITEDNINSYVEEEVKTELVINAISEKESLALTDEEYQAGLQSYVEEYDYTDTAELEEDQGADSMKFIIQKEKVANFLLQTAQITQKEVAADAADEEETEEISSEDSESAQG